MEIDNTIKSLSARNEKDEELPLKNEENSFVASFAKRTKANKLVRFQYGESKVEFRLVDGVNVAAKLSKNRVTYQSVYPDTDLVYYVGQTGLKEEWILHKYNGKSTFSMAVNVKNAKLKEQNDGSLEFLDTKGKVLFSIPRPYMIDAADRISYDVKLKLRTEGNKTYLDIQADESWLKDDARKYPVVLDPTLIVQGTYTTMDTFVSEKNPTSYYDGETFLISGTHVDYGKTRSFIKFDLQPLLSGAQITSAKLYLNQYATVENQQVDLYPVTSSWKSNEVTWNKQPSIGTKLASTTVGAAGEYGWDLTSQVKKWYNGTSKNYGVSLRHTVETNDRKSFRSSDYATDPTMKPKLVITYTVSPLGQEEFWTSSVTNVNTFNGNFFLPETDLEIKGRGISTKVDRYYNSRSNSSGIFGFGWSSTIEQHVIDSGDGPIQYIDGDGTIHSFTYDSTEGLYKTTEVLQLTLKKNADSSYVLENSDQVQYLFDQSGRLIQIKDANNNVTVISYKNGYPSTITDASNRVVRFTYNSNNLVVKVTDPANRMIEYGYDANNNLTSVVKKDEAGITLTSKSYGYDTGHNLVDVTDGNGNKKTITYVNDQVTEISQPLTVDGQVQTTNTKFGYDPANKLTTVTDAKGVKTLFQHNDYGNIIQITQDPTGLNYKRTFTYNAENQLISKKDANANAINSNATYSYTYDKNGNLTTVTNPLNETTTTKHDENNNLVNEVDSKGNITTHEYDVNNNNTSTTDARVKSSAQKYNPFGNVISESNQMSPGNNLAINGSFEIDRNADQWPDDWSKVPTSTSTITWETSGLVAEGITLGKKSIKVTNPTSTTAIASSKITYDPNKTYILSGYIKTSTNATGKATIYGFGFNSSKGTYKAIQGTWIAAGQGSTRVHVVINPGAMPAGTNELQIRGYTTSGTGEYWFDGLQIEEEFYGAYNILENGDLERDTDPAGDLIPDRWFAAGDMTLSTTVDGLDNTEAHTGKYSMRIKGEAGKWKTLRQDVKLAGSVGAMFTVSGFSKVENPNPQGGIYGYVIETYLGSTRQETFAFNFDKTKSHDWQHRTAEIKVSKPFDNVKVFYEYSEQSGTAWFDTAKVFVGSITTTHEYDANGNYETKTTDPVGRTVENTYDAVGNITKVNVGTHITSYANDGLDRLTQVIDAKGGVTQYLYDANGNRTKMINAKNKATSYEYNELNLVKKVTDALKQTTSYEYDLIGNKTKTLYPNGNTVGYTYDSVYRQSFVTHNGVERYAFEYDPNGNIIKETDKAKGEATTFTYDANNKLKSVVDTGNKMEYTYDENGNVTERKYTVGTAISTHGFTYNALDQLSKVVENGVNMGQFTYHETDQIASRKTGDGTTTLNEYNGAEDLLKRSIINKNGELIDQFQYAYDTKKNITSVFSKAGNTLYEYDELDQLIKETRPDGTIYEYTYDSVGNRLNKKVIKGSSITTTDYMYNDANQISTINGVDYTYDKNGNLVNDGRRIYVYDAENRLTTVKDSGGNTIASFTYRADGMRNTMTTSAGTIKFHYDENKNVIYETDGSNNIIARYTYNASNQPLSMMRNNQYYYYQLNGHGDVVAVTDANGTVVATYEYDAFGNVLRETGTLDNPYRYSGYRYDAETGLYYLQARYYQPEHGNFLTKDPHQGDCADPLTKNGYSYANNNPEKYFDPDGNIRIPVWGRWCGPGHGGKNWNKPKPVDNLDYRCMQHDMCYKYNGYFDCRCDGQLIRGIKKSLPYMKPRERRKARLIMTYFAVSLCVARD
ncbi:DNRLRE domain-containing protein [Laceyella sacchari]|uniref:DNRLRE domain-containing protein n=1 Tax=Laceyella sacchari TaxID=37482 RepID=A0ABY5U5Z4_LACSH|nr:DNRLRE domain-containing protein [Laceyella sacchari]UWE05062.1 DNRLRE domain-containing protein [Laceyella sacchari]